MVKHVVYAHIPLRFEVEADDKEKAKEFIEEYINRSTEQDILGFVDGDIEITSVEEDG